MADLVNAISGKNGDCWADGTQIEITEWTMEPSIAVPKYASNLTSNHKVAVHAVQDFTGTFNAVIPDAGLPLDLGDIVELSLYGPVTVAVTAIISSHPITVDINDGNPTMVAFTFEPRGVPEFSGNTSSGS